MQLHWLSCIGFSVEISDSFKICYGSIQKLISTLFSSCLLSGGDCISTTLWKINFHTNDWKVLWNTAVNFSCVFYFCIALQVTQHIIDLKDDWPSLFRPPNFFNKYRSVTVDLFIDNLTNWDASWYCGLFLEIWGFAELMNEQVYCTICLTIVASH